eukprot:scaffold2748_cov193-Alexandrium_tamarense.AAC.30
MVSSVVIVYGRVGVDTALMHSFLVVFSSQRQSYCPRSHHYTIYLVSCSHVNCVRRTKGRGWFLVCSIQWGVYVWRGRT